MTHNLICPVPAEYGFASFAELVGERTPIVGETDLAFDHFHNHLLASLLPMTPYEAVIAENLVAIEWEVFQHRRMRDAAVRRMTVNAINDALLNCERSRRQVMMDEACEAWVAAGNDEDEFEFESLDWGGIRRRAEDLAQKSFDVNADVQAHAEEELIGLGLSPLEIMGAAYRNPDGGVAHHEQKIQELERRRRSVKADFDALQKARPVDAEVIDG